MAEMKFILIEQEIDENTIQYLSIIFDKAIVHRLMYLTLKIALNTQFKNQNRRVVSAGFYNTNTQTTYGESESLNIKCHPKSNKILDSSGYNIFYSKENKLIDNPISIR